MDPKPLLVAFSFGALVANWRSYLSLRMNVLGLFYDLLGLFPTKLVNDPVELEKLVDRHRINWKIAEFLTVFEGPSMQIQKLIQIPSRDKNRDIPIRVYQPINNNNNKIKRKFPVVVFIHGGGYSFGSTKLYDSFVREIAHKVGCIVCSIEYRLAPKYKFPCGLEDCEDVLMYLCNKDSQNLLNAFNIDYDQIAVCGDSAGANFTANLAVYAKKKNIKLMGQCLLYPTTSAFSIPFWRESNNRLPLPSDSAVLFSQGPMLSTNSIVIGAKLYLNSLEDVNNPRLSIILHPLEDLKGTAPAFVITASCDLLRDEGIEYAKKLVQAGVPVQHKEFPDTIHAFMSLHFAYASSQGHAALHAFLKSIFYSPPIARI